jgi:hypothetical protein
MYGIVPTMVPSPVSTARVASMACSEVEHLDPAVGGHHHVARRQVAVRDLLLVRGGQRVGERQRELEEPCHR